MFFFSSPSTASRIEAFRAAEQQLLGYAKTRFGHRNQDPSRHEFELFDTPISKPDVIKKSSAKCQIHESSDTDEHSIHGVKVTNTQLGDGGEGGYPAPLVLLHGYANGSLYFYRNLMGLSQHFGRVYALDMMGWGLSSRPKFDLVTDESVFEGSVHETADDVDDDLKKSTRQKVAAAELFFVESLESWRKKHNLSKMTLAGHSMGGYMSVAYAERYPEHVECLILMSPVGVPVKRPEDDKRLKSLPFYLRGMVSTARYLFNSGITPGAFLRSLPLSRSKAMVDGYIENRLPAITCEDEREHLSEYLYQNSMMPSSGESCLSAVLEAGAFARIPLVNRIPNIKPGLEVHFIYGENDWMGYQGGLDTQRLCLKKPDDSPTVFVHGVRNASHLLMLDNYEELNAALIIAANGEHRLTRDTPRPIEFACNELVGYRSMHKSYRGAIGETHAAAFFRGGRFNIREQNEVDEERKAEENLS